MIDWPDIARQAVWITGAAIVVACLSYHQWGRGDARRSPGEAVPSGPLLAWLVVGAGASLFGWALAQGEPAAGWFVRLAVWVVVMGLVWRRWRAARGSA